MLPTPGSGGQQLSQPQTQGLSNQASIHLSDGGLLSAYSSAFTLSHPDRFTVCGCVGVYILRCCDKNFPYWSDSLTAFLLWVSGEGLGPRTCITLHICNYYSSRE